MIKGYLLNNLTSAAIIITEIFHDSKTEPPKEEGKREVSLNWKTSPTVKMCFVPIGWKPWQMPPQEEKFTLTNDVERFKYDKRSIGNWPRGKVYKMHCTLSRVQPSLMTMPAVHQALQTNWLEQHRSFWA